MLPADSFAHIIKQAAGSFRQLYLLKIGQIKDITCMNFARTVIGLKPQGTSMSVNTRLVQGHVTKPASLVQQETVCHGP